jgi:hypothetical protein
MGTITLQFVEGDGVGAALIKWFGHGKFSHVDCVLPDSGNLLGARADQLGKNIKSGVRVRPYGYTKKEPVEKVEIHCSDHQQQLFYAFMAKQLGKSYNRLGIVAFFFSTEWTTQGNWFCSQLVTAGLQAAGLLKELTVPPNKIDPDDLRLMVSAVWKV